MYKLNWEALYQSHDMKWKMMENTKISRAVVSYVSDTIISPVNQ